MQAEQTNKLKEELRAEITVFWGQLNYLKDLFEVKNHLSRITDKRFIENIPKNELAPNFFFIAYCGMIESVYIVLAKLYDKNSDSKSIQKLLNKCNKFAELLTDDDTIRQELKALNSKLNKDETLSNAIDIIFFRRNKFWAHNDKEYFNSRGEDTEHCLPNSSLYCLIWFTEKALNLLMNMLSLTSNEKPKYNNDLDNLFSQSKTS